MKKYVITGGARFIESHRAEYLPQEEHHIIILNSLRAVFESNLKELNVQFEEGDIRDEKLINKLVKDANGVFHLVALMSVSESLLKIEECIDINTKGTINILEAAKNNPGCKVTLSTSATNYGNNPVLPKVETMSSEPTTPYSITKLDGEFYLKIDQDQWNVSTTSLRYFNVFKLRQNPNSAYVETAPIFINKTLLNEPLTIYGDGLQTRDFIYVKES